MGQTFITHSAVKITFVFVEKSEDISIADMKHQLFHVRGEAFGRLSLVEKRRQLWMSVHIKWKDRLSLNIRLDVYICMYNWYNIMQ